MIVRASLVLGVVLALTACSGPDNGTVEVTGPPLDQFADVSVPLVESCGSLDCHGQPGRNLQIWGKYGQRLSPNEFPSGADAGVDEIEATYRSVVGLEPEVMASVVKDSGAHPERLTMIRKARGTEAHKGGTVMVEGDHLDTCITSWLASQVQRSECKAARTVIEPPP
jgi:hypothetical protein